MGDYVEIIMKLQSIKTLYFSFCLTIRFHLYARTFVTLGKIIKKNSVSPLGFTCVYAYLRMLSNENGAAVNMLMRYASVFH